MITNKRSVVEGDQTRLMVWVRARVLRVRREYKQCCGEKIRYILQRDYGKSPSVATIYRILGTEYQLRSKWKKYSIRGPVHKGEKPRDVVQTDTVDLGNLYAFTAIDTYTKEVSVIVQPTLTSTAGKEALTRQLATFGSIAHIQRDGGSEFKKDWQEYATKHIPSIRTARPYKKNEQAFIERFNGILRKECVGYTKYKKTDLQKVQEKINIYLDYYHNKRPHLSLNMLTPSEFAKQHTMSHLT
jgi:transposase InsO family protein